MPWNGSGTFNRIYSWVADKAAGLDISSSRMDTDTNDIASSGFGNCLTRDGQGQPIANLPMAGFRHTGVQNAVNRSDYAAFGQLQDGLPNWTVAGGTVDALTATFTPALTSLSDGQLCFVRASGVNLTATPTFSPNGLTPRVITKFGGTALVAGDIFGALQEMILRYNLANTRWELLNPSVAVINAGTVITPSIANGAVTYAKIQNVAASRLLGNPTGSPAAPSEISVGTGLTLSGSSLAATIGPNLVPNYLSGLTLSTAGGSGTMAIAAGVANDSTNTVLMNLASGLSKTTASWAVGSGNGGLDTGSIANSTWYYFYEIERLDTSVVDVIFSLSASLPALPANYTIYRRIGAWETDTSAHWISVTQTGDKFIRATSVADFSGAATASRVATTLSVPTGIVVEALFRASLNISGLAAACIFTSLQESDQAPVNGGLADLSNVVNTFASGSFARLTNTSAQIGVRSQNTAGTVTINTYGWIDTRGK